MKVNLQIPRRSVAFVFSILVSLTLTTASRADHKNHFPKTIATDVQQVGEMPKHPKTILRLTNGDLFERVSAGSAPAEIIPALTWE